MYALKINKHCKIDRKETRNFKHLKEILIESSVSDTFEDAIHEWTEIGRYFVMNDDYYCVCGKPNIHELCIIENILTGNKLTLGNCCIDRISSSDSRFFFKALTKISNDRLRSANKALINFAHKQNVFDHWEFAFYSNIWRKHTKTLTPKQLARKRYLNEKLLEAFKVTSIPKGMR